MPKKTIIRRCTCTCKIKNQVDKNQLSTRRKDSWPNKEDKACRWSQKKWENDENCLNNPISLIDPSLTLDIIADKSNTGTIFSVFNLRTHSSLFTFVIWRHDWPFSSSSHHYWLDWFHWIQDLAASKYSLIWNSILKSKEVTRFFTV